MTAKNDSALHHAIVRAPGGNFGKGLTRAGLGPPQIDTALSQHASYCAALRRCGLALTELDPDSDFADAAFVEDTAVVFGGRAILTRPGATSRRGEVEKIAPEIARQFTQIARIQAPGTLDGGDVCQAGTHFLIGISERTNAEGARQLSAIVAKDGFTSETIDVRNLEGILHLKSAVSYLGDGRMLSIGALADHRALARYQVLPMAPHETYAANVLRVNDTVVLAAGFPLLAAAVGRLGYAVIALDMSEFRKMDGALSCLSLRF